MILINDDNKVGEIEKEKKVVCYSHEEEVIINYYFQEIEDNLSQRIRGDNNTIV